MDNMKDYVESIFNKKFEKKYYKKFMKITPKGKILDLGCGVGSASNIFINAGYDYIGYDIDEYNINLGKNYNHSLNISVANMINIPQQNPKANGAVYAYSLLSLTTEEVNQTFKSCYNNLTNNGNVLIFTRCKEFDTIPNIHFNVIPKDKLIKILQVCWFIVIYNKNLDKLSICLIASKKIIRRV